MQRWQQAKEFSSAKYTQLQGGALMVCTEGQLRRMNDWPCQMRCSDAAAVALQAQCKAEVAAQPCPRAVLVCCVAIACGGGLAAPGLFADEVPDEQDSMHLLLGALQAGALLRPALQRQLPEATPAVPVSHPTARVLPALGVAAAGLSAGLSPPCS